MKTFTAIFLFVIMTISVFGQDFYYSNNSKYSLLQAENWTIIQVQENYSDTLWNKSLESMSFTVRKRLIPERGFLWLEKKDKSIIDSSIDRLKEEIPIVRIFPAYYSIDDVGDTIYNIMTDIFHVKFVDNLPEEEIKRMNKDYFVEIIEKLWGNEYLLRVTEESPLNTLEVANLYYESRLTVWSLPDFYVRIKPESIQDPNFPNQWHLQNTGQNGGVVGLDINVLPAWIIRTGKPDIIVAVADDGIEPHEDFYQGQLLQGYNAANQTNSGLPGISDNHGQAVAGIIAANHNGLGVRGIAPEVKLMSIRIIGASLARQAAAFDTAWYRGADVINISFGLGHQYYDNIASALQRAMSEGRNGKGTVIVKSGGNTGAEVTFPATVPGVLVVGAVTNTNQPPDYTPRSSHIDIIAPSGGGDGTLGITTTDRQAPNGYNKSSNYYNNFTGTSAAAPQASGVAALILSLNPQLTEQQVRNVIIQSAITYGQTNWAGAGRLNANRALYSVFQFTGPSIVCTSNSTFNLGWIPPSASVTWSFSPSNLVTPNSGSGTSATFRGPNCSYHGNGKLNFTINEPGYDSYQLSKDIIVNGPDYGDVELDIYTSEGEQVANYGGNWQLCQDTHYHIYLMNNSGCSTSNYSWILPQGWSKNWENQNMVSIYTGSSWGGNFVVKAQTCCSSCGSGVTIHSAYLSSSSCYPGLFMIYPNPADSYVYIDLEQEKSDGSDINQKTEYNLIMTDNMGMVKHTAKIRELPYRIDTSGMSKGLYLVNITYDDRKFSSWVLIK
jgi:serine protease